MITEPENLMTKMQLADALGVHRKTVEQWHRKGLPSVVVRINRLYVESMVRRWLSEQGWLRVKIKP